MQRKPLSKAKRIAILHRDRFTCQYCGRKAPSVVLHVDHVISVADGGSNHPNNLKAACFDCNLGKSARSFYPPSDVYVLDFQAKKEAPLERFVRPRSDWPWMVDALERANAKTFSREYFGQAARLEDARELTSVSMGAEEWL